MKRPSSNRPQRRDSKRLDSKNRTPKSDSTSRRKGLPDDYIVDDGRFLSIREDKREEVCDRAREDLEDLAIQILLSRLPR